MTSKVYIVDDNKDLCQSLEYLFDSVDIITEIYHSPIKFLECYQQSPGCLLLDVRMPEMTGMALQDLLRRKHIQIPIIFMSGHSDIPMAVRAMKEGAFDFFTKPFNHHALLEAIQHAIEQDRNRRMQSKKFTAFSVLTPQELDITERIVSSQSTADIAKKLCLSPKTIEYHRAKIMRKLGVSTIAELVKLYCTYQQYISL